MPIKKLKPALALDADVSQFNMWLGYNPNDLTLAIEYDNYDIPENDDYWSMMLLSQLPVHGLVCRHPSLFSRGLRDWFVEHESDRFTLHSFSPLRIISGLNVEYSTTSVDVDWRCNYLGDYNEFYIEGLIYLLSFRNL